MACLPEHELSSNGKPEKAGLVWELKVQYWQDNAFSQV